MSTELHDIEMLNTGRDDDPLRFVQFYGGEKKGRMVQITQGNYLGDNPHEPGWIHLTKSDAVRLICALTRWVSDDL